MPTTRSSRRRRLRRATGQQFASLSPSAPRQPMWQAFTRQSYRDENAARLRGRYSKGYFQDILQGILQEFLWFTARLSLPLKQRVGAGNQRRIRMHRAIVAELLGIGGELPCIDYRRVVFRSVISIEPGENEPTS